MTIADHYQATRVHLAVGILANRVYDVVRMNGSSPVRDNYVILWPDSPRVDDQRYTAAQAPDSSMLYRFDTRVVSTSMAGLLQHQDAVRNRLIGQVIEVPGRVTGPVRLIPGVEEGRVLHDASSNLLHVTETFEFWSRRA